MTTRDDINAAILVALAAEEEQAAAQPEPPKWKTWEKREYDDTARYGTLWRPGLVGDLAATEARRVRTLRCLHALHAAGLVVITVSEGNRLWRVQLTDEGRAAVAALTAPTAAPATEVK